MILGHGTVVHYPPVKIDETEDSWQMELNSLLIRQLSKNRETIQESTDAINVQEIGENTTDNVLETFYV